MTTRNKRPFKTWWGTVKRNWRRQLFSETLEARRCLTEIGLIPHLIDGTQVSSPTSIATADFDDDGDLDLFVAARNQDGWYRNDPDRSLSTFHPLAVTETRVPYKSALAMDMDGDADFDIVVRPVRGMPYWFRNQGSGQFSDVALLPTMLGPGDQLQFNDINLDGRPDLVTSIQTCGFDHCSHVIAWQENTGDGSWSEEKRVLTVHPELDSLNFADLNNDQMDDLILGNSYCSVVTGQCYYQTNGFSKQGASQFDRQPTRLHRSELPSAARAAEVDWRDVDGDGDRDGIVKTFADGETSIGWIENLDGEGNFSAAVSVFTHVASPNEMLPHAIGDVDGDHDLDIVVLGEQGAMYLATFDTAVGEFNFVSQVSRWFEGPTDALLIDIDGDDLSDLVAVSESRNEVAWFRRATDQPAFFSAAVAIGHKLDPIKQSLPIDFDVDGDVDFLVATADSHMMSLEWYENIDGNGMFTRHFIRELEATWFQAGDFDNDGDIDLLVHQSNNSVWLPNNGAFQFGAPRFVSNDELSTSVPVDFDQDGDLDLVHVARDAITWYENIDRQGVFERIEVTTGLRRAELEFVGDFDGNGDVDVVYRERCSRECDDRLMRFEHRNGSLVFHLLMNLKSEPFVSNSTALGDVDGDGDVDLVLSESRSSFQLVLNNAGTLGIAIRYATEIYRPILELADMDGDGDLDVVSSHDSGREMQWHENLDGRWQFSAARQINVFDRGWHSVWFSDIDRDNLPDMFVVPTGDPQVYWYRNSVHSIAPVLGDANRDGVFDSSDLVAVFAAGRFEDGLAHPVSFEQGDWNGDEEFTTADLVVAFQAGFYFGI